MLKKTLDTNVIVYSLLKGHPASDACDSLIRDGKHIFYTTPITPFEVYYILMRVYGIRKEEAASKALALFDSPLFFTEITVEDARPALKRCAAQDLDANDSLILQACLNSGIPSVSSDDRRLLKIGELEGINTQSPITEEHRERMREWEEEKLPPSGLPRLLKRVHSWMARGNPQTAQRFFDATKGLRHIPD